MHAGQIVRWPQSTGPPLLSRVALAWLAYEISSTKIAHSPKNRKKKYSQIGIGLLKPLLLRWRSGEGRQELRLEPPPRSTVMDPRVGMHKNIVLLLNNRIEFLPCFPKQLLRQKTRVTGERTWTKLKKNKKEKIELAYTYPHPTAPTTGRGLVYLLKTPPPSLPGSLRQFAGSNSIRVWWLSHLVCISVNPWIPRTILLY